MYSIPVTMKDDINELKKKIIQFNNGEISSMAFKSFRVPMGIYEHREENIYMMRIRIAGGVVSMHQLESIAKLAIRFNLKIHFTTRQDIQLHNVNIEDIAEIYDELYGIGLTCKGGGGNTVRNIPACWGAGICPYEKFNVFPYAIALTDYFLPFHSSYNMPRKLKIAFSGCERDCANATVQDLGFIAKIKDNKKGFSVYIAGGLGSHSRVTDKIYEFLPEEKIGIVAETVKRLFDKYGNRKNKQKARLRYVIENMGVKKFKEIFKDELAEVEAEGEIVLNIKEINLIPHNIVMPEEKFETDKNYLIWEQNNTFKHNHNKNDDMFYVRIPLALGEIESDRLLNLSRKMGKIGIRFFHTTNTQDLIVPYVKQNRLSAVYFYLKELKFTDIERKNINRILTCKGALTCKLGICYSTELGKAIAMRLDKEKIFLRDHTDVSIKISGCPNNCGHHIIGAIGLSGAVRYINSKPMPFYNVYINGKVMEGETRLGKIYGIVPAKYIPDLIYEILVTYYQEPKKYDNDFYKFIENEERFLKNIISRYTRIDEVTEDLYYDWGSEKEFTLAGRGPGECGAGVFDLIETNISESEKYLKKGDSFNAVLYICRSLLVIRGIDTNKDDVIINSFIENFIDTGWISKKYIKLLENIKHYLSSKKGLENIDNTYISSLIDRVKVLYDSLDSNLEFQIPREEDKKKSEEVESANIAILDLKGVECPINYVKAKLFIEKLPKGTVVEIYLDDGEPIQNVPVSLKDDGQKILKIEKIDNYFKVIVEKVV